MIPIALAALLHAGFVQDDPSVTYREGLYQEIYEGKLDKALELSHIGTVAIRIALGGLLGRRPATS